MALDCLVLVEHSACSVAIHHWLKCAEGMPFVGFVTPDDILHGPSASVIQGVFTPSYISAMQLQPTCKPEDKVRVKASRDLPSTDKQAPEKWQVEVVLQALGWRFSC